MTETMTKPTDVTLIREIKAPVERVFSLWTDEKAVMSWFGLDGFVNRDCSIDARPGGAWHVESTTPDGRNVRMEGTFLDIQPPSRIVQNWCHVSDDGTRGNVTEVEITFEPSETGTRLTVNHRKIKDTPELFEAGWTHSLAKVEALALA